MSNAPRWPDDLQNPTWHDHFYSPKHSPIDDEEHHKAVDALLRRISSLQDQLTQVRAEMESHHRYFADEGWVACPVCDPGAYERHPE